MKEFLSLNELPENQKAKELYLKYARAEPDPRYLYVLSLLELCRDPEEKVKLDPHLDQFIENMWWANQEDVWNLLKFGPEPEDEEGDVLVDPKAKDAMEVALELADLAYLRLGEVT